MSSTSNINMCSTTRNPRCSTTRNPRCSTPPSRLMSPSCPSLKGVGPSIEQLLPSFSFNINMCGKSASDQMMKDMSFLVQDASPSSIQHESSSVFGSSSFAKLFGPTVLGAGASSLPVSPVAQELGRYCRSHSAPSNCRNSAGDARCRFCMTPPTPQGEPGPAETTSNSTVPSAAGNGINSDGQDFCEGPADCRICQLELAGEGGETLKMECGCKGALGRAHRDCAIEWFSRKGDRNCEICHQDVQNLPAATLTRLQESAGTQSGNRLVTALNGNRNWHDVPILVIISVLAYFCFLEQLLVVDNGFAAIGVSVPFSCLLGFLSSLTSATMVWERYIFVYASLQFVLVAAFAHMFHSLLRMQAIVSVMIATFAGFGTAMSASSVIVEYVRWRLRCRLEETSGAAGEPSSRFRLSAPAPEGAF